MNLNIPQSNPNISTLNAPIIPSYKGLPELSMFIIGLFLRLKLELRNDFISFRAQEYAYNAYVEYIIKCSLAQATLGSDLLLNI